jgi:predicted  nucleic acid-binding Zn-ribbon protein
MAEDLEIKIGADTSQLQAELQAAQNEMKRLEAQIKKTSDVKEIQKLQTSLRYVKETMVSLEAEGAKLNNVLDKGLKKGAGGATQTLTDLSRIAQDAPYGFIAISNNISPLIESFGRLRAESGSTGGALKSLVSGLAGGGGLGLAFAAVTAAVSFAQIGFDMWTRSSKKAKEAADEQKKAIDGIYQAQAKEGTDVISLIAVLKNETETRQRKLDAIKELNKISPEVFGNLKLEKDAVIGVDSAYKNWLANQKSVIAAKVIQAKIDKVIEEQLKAQGTTETGNAKKFGNSVEALKQRIQTQKEYIRTGNLEGNALIIQTNLLKSYEDELKKSENNTSALTSQLDDLAKQLQEVSKGINIPEDKKTAKTKKDVETLADVIKKFREDVRDEIAVGVAFNQPSFEQQIKLYENVIQDVIKKFNVDPKSDLIVGLRVELSGLEIQKALSEIPSKVEAQSASIKPIDTNKLIKLTPFKKLPTLEPKTVSEWVSAQQQILSTATADIISTLAENIGSAIATGNFGSVFSGLFDILGNAAIELGKKAILFSEGFAAIKKALASGSATLGIGAGIALIALGALIKAAGKKLTPKFATGTTFAPGGMALVGERGPELVNLPRGSQVIPSGRTSSMVGAMQTVEVYGKLRGQDIYFSNKKYTQTYNRQT